MKMKLFLLSAVLVAMISAMLVRPASATTVIRLNFDQIVNKADVILSGRVINQENRVIETAGKKVPYTYVTLSVDEKLKGTFKGDTYTLRFKGGNIPEKNLTLHVGGMPTFKTGQEVFLFVRESTALPSPIVGFSQGYFHVTQDPKTGARVMRRADGDPVSEGFVTGLQNKTQGQQVTYEIFKNQVKNLIKTDSPAQ